MWGAQTKSVITLYITSLFINLLYRGLFNVYERITIKLYNFCPRNRSI
uniref:Uncharacterized protein n=1 Tax=Myoviridae sp. ctcyQ27 TaxID=2825139 RepID=A0A8S5UF22_9CAUD|nr:MAG TPA: hypothetical protein [Myoviridae sp. ctcyQ27]